MAFENYYSDLPMDLSEKDLKILIAMARSGGKISAEQLSTKLDISPRTVRYRLNRLRDLGYLRELYTMTHERKLGMRHICLILQENLEFGPIPMNLINSLFHISYLSPVYGCFNGWLMDFGVSVGRGNDAEKTCEILKDRGIVEDFFFYEVIDFHSFQPELRYMNHDGLWDWTHETWISEIKQCLGGEHLVDLKFDKNPGIIKFDEIDVELLTTIKMDARISYTELGKKVDLSGTQVSNRLSRLEEEGIIKGYRLFFKEPINPMVVYCFFHVRNKPDQVLSALSHLPFPKEILYGSGDVYALRVRCYGDDASEFLRGFHLLKPHLDWYKFGFAVSVSQGPIQYFKFLFDKEAGIVDSPIYDYEGIIDEFCKNNDC
ncbi:MAG: hypothetical protein BAJATHORv1_10216 [Candidatus Thorarchaeota archaeon]|nr:MAG: hypothetical protein BAJATHORv1_10216 [Candidatus Thorarchaeota archaeon]